MFDRFTERARRVVVLAREEAERFNHEYLGTEHLLLGIVKEGGGVAVSVIKRLGVDLDYIKNEFERRYPVVSNMIVAGDIPFTTMARKVLEYAIDDAKELGHSYVGTEHLLLGLMRGEDSLAYRILNGCGLTYQDVRKEITAVLLEPSSKRKKSRKTPALDEFGRDLTEMAVKGLLDPVIGRADEVERIIQVLTRRRKNNPVLIGEPGVGKTAIVEGLAQRIVRREVPELLYDKRLISLDLGGMIAGTKYRGQFEERLKGVMKEATKSKDVILFLDELHTLVGAGAAEGSMDGANIMKPALSRGEIQCIGATTLDEYRRHIEKNGALERRFQSVMVEQPTVEETIKIICGLRDEYEIHHKVTITDGAIEAAARLSERYIADRFLPDKAIDAVDEAASMVHLKLSTYPPEIQKLYREIDDVMRDKLKWIEAQKFERALRLRDEEEALKARLESLKNKWRENQGDVEPIVTEEDIARVISKTTGIPVNRIEEEETQKLKNIESELSRHIIGQSEAIKVVSAAIRRSRAGLKDANRPMGSFLFVGPTGVGKTELTKVLAERLFGNADSIIRLDMSEYMEKHNASTMIGAPPGYVGFEEGGKLTEKVRRHPYSVVLFDEIDKAHSDIFNILLQVMDEGRLTDSAGRAVSFRNVILIMTSNMGTRSLEKVANMGFQGQDSALADKKYRGSITAELKKHFNPEFLNRIDEVVIFNHLLKEEIKSILSIMVSELSRRLFEKGITLELGAPVFDWLVEKSYNPAYGARELRRVVQKNLSDPIAESILFQGVKDGKVMIDICEGLPKISVEKGELAGL